MCLTIITNRATERRELRMKKTMLLIFSMLMFCSCGSSVTSGAEKEVSTIADSIPVKEQSEIEIHEEMQQEPQQNTAMTNYSVVEILAKDTVDSLSIDITMGELAIRTIYDYLIENVFFADPVGLDTWRYMSNDSDTAIPFIENRALSPLLFQIGSCEDFAATMVMLLRTAGFQADYVSGFTVSVQGVFIDHAWAVVELDGQWYHIDPQLEQNIVRDILRYRYYLKSDKFMLADHRWGENLISFWNLPEEEKQNIRNNHMPPICTENYPTPPIRQILLPTAPDIDKINSQIQQMKNESGKDSLQQIVLNVEPPILVAEYHITPPLLVE